MYVYPPPFEFPWLLPHNANLLKSIYDKNDRVKPHAKIDLKTPIRIFIYYLVEW